MAKTPLSLWILLALAGCAWAWGLLGALTTGDPLAQALWLAAPPLSLAALGWSPAWLATAGVHARLRRRLGNPVAPLRIPHAAWAARGLGAGVALGGTWDAMLAYSEDNLSVLVASGGACAIGLVCLLVGHARTARVRRAQARPWRALLALQRTGSFEDPGPIAEHFRTLRRGTETALTPAQGRVLEDRARPILAGLRDHGVTHLTEMARAGRATEALEILDRWQGERDALRELFVYLQLTRERIGALRAQLGSLSAHHWAERLAALEPLLAEATALIEEAQPAAALERADELLLQLPDTPGAPVDDLRDRALALQAQAREQMAEAHRSAQAAAEAVMHPHPHPPRDASLSVIEGTPIDNAREAMTYARQHLDRSDPESAAGWLAHAEHHAQDVVGPMGIDMRDEIAELRVKCGETEPPPARVDTPKPEPVKETAAPDPERVLAEFQAREALAATAPKTARVWQDAVLLVAGLIFIAGFCLPWSGGDPSPPTLRSGMHLPVVLRGVNAAMGQGEIGRGLLAHLEVIGAYLTAATGAFAALLGLLRFASPGTDPRTLLRSLRVFLVIAWLMTFSTLLRVGAGASAIGWSLLHDDAALPPRGSVEPMLVPLLRQSGIGLWLMVAAFVAITIAAFAPRRRHVSAEEI